jgi:predicted nucleotidyltransferase
VEARHVYLVGSAATGYSLSPLKAGRPFKRRSAEHPYASDIDIVIVNQGLFMQMWNVLLNFDRTRRLVPLLPRPEADRTRPIDKLRADVYWGTVQHRLTPAGTEGARRVRLLLGTTTRELPFLGYVAKARVYRRVEDLEAYHEQSARQLAHALRQEQR